MTLRECDATHCSGADAELNEVCKQEGWAIGHPVITRDANGPCQCHCSCMALNTPVVSGDGTSRAIQDFAHGDKVLAAGTDLKWHPVLVCFSGGTESGVQPNTVFVKYATGELVVTPDHLFLTKNGLLRADKLSAESKLLSPEGREVDVLNVEIGTFSGGFHHISTSIEDPGEDLTDHLLSVNGVVCADYVVQLFYRVSPARFRNITVPTDNMPTVGSREYGARHKKADALWALGGEFPTEGGVFAPSDSLRVEIPPDALPFISEEEAQEIARLTENFRSFSDPDSQAWTQYLFEQYRAFYPDVTYNIDWSNNEVNAYAWRDGGGRRQILVLGGLIRHPALFIEGIALVIAHELGHHYGGPPTGGSSLSCEGQADYAAVSKIMRRVWFGEYYITVATRGISQMARFFNVPEPGSNSGMAGCEHPQGLCRIYTYNAAVNLQPKPACAGR